MTIDERIASEVGRHVPEVDEQMAWRRIESLVPRRRRGRAIRLVSVAVAAFGLVVLGFILRPVVSPGPGPVGDPESPFVGTWVSTDLISTTVIEVSEDRSVDMLMHDFFSVCLGSQSTMVATGHLEGDHKLVFPAPALTCDDGSQPAPVHGPSIEEDLLNLTFIRDPLTDILTDNFGTVWMREGAFPDRDPTAPPSEAELNELLNGFVGARVAGEGAQLYMVVPEEEIPLLYATTSGVSYERGEFEPVPGIEWPYGDTAFKVRMFVGDTVVEQLVFVPPKGRPGLWYKSDGFGTHIAPTTENGQPVAVPYIFEGEVTLQVLHPWVFIYDRTFIRRVPEEPGVLPTTDGGERNGWDHLYLISDPESIGVEGVCQAGPPADAAALVESMRSDPGLDVTDPVRVSTRAGEALMMDLSRVAEGSQCHSWTRDLYPRLVRLYLFDAPESSSMRVLAIAIVAPQARFDKALETAWPIVESVEFNSP